MNREIKFRGWDEKNKEMVYNINLLFSNRLNDCFEEYEECGLKIMQYTGLKDKNGVEIYDGDIMYDDYRESNGVVAFSNGKYTFDWENISEDLSEACGDTQIIGNIHENKELLKEG